MAKNKEYQKIPGRGYRTDGVGLVVRRSARLWLASDHLLMIFSTMFNEEFKRFYLRDIQAITVRKTNNAFIWSGSWLAVAILSALLSLGVEDAIGLWVLRGLGGLFLLCAVIAIASGQSCIAEIKTAVHLEELSSLKRVRHAKAALAILQPLIEQAQGKKLSEEPVVETSASSPVANQNSPAATTASPPPFPINPDTPS